MATRGRNPRICGVCHRSIRYLKGSVSELETLFQTDLSESIKPIEDEKHAEYVCHHCCETRPDDVLAFLVNIE